MMFPDRKIVVRVVKELKAFLFPDHFPAQRVSLKRLKKTFKKQLYIALSSCGKGEETDAVCEDFFSELENIRKKLLLDAQAAFDGDPAAYSIDEVILTYPGFFAVYIHRLAHSLYRANVPYIPRFMSEYAHGKTGIDINPGADIGEYFCIDHGTGIVIGETAVIGRGVKIYQGVTLGALSTRGGQQLKNVRRHPLVEDNVTIYAGATILGGDTRIGANSVIGGNAFITESVPANSKVYMNKCIRPQALGAQSPVCNCPVSEAAK
ncbi:serine acetyltransferase [Treponema sp. OMZ 840]|uniref:serine O-acetyltransferase n=1 Tax=Treponema sp. OMZ 840 TaxID=244313 RepID=UPI003D947F12